MDADIYLTSRQLCAIVSSLVDLPYDEKVSATATNVDKVMPNIKNKFTKYLKYLSF